MVRKLSLLLGLLFFVSFTAHAQDKAEVFGGYSYMHNDNSPGGNLNGWELSGQYKFTGWLGAVADFDGHYGSPSGFDTQFHTFMFGPQVSFPARVSPFAHVLFGGAHEHVNGVGGDTSFAAAVGGGIDAKLTGPIYWRVIQGDWIRTSLFGRDQNNGRLSTGIVIQF
ncbi:MAG: hypothetical protein WB987_11080 [Candidatus Acidiferrales bacterium]